MCFPKKYMKFELILFIIAHCNTLEKYIIKYIGRKVKKKLKKGYKQRSLIHVFRARCFVLHIKVAFLLTKLLSISRTIFHSPIFRTFQNEDFQKILLKTAALLKRRHAVEWFYLNL